MVNNVDIEGSRAPFFARTPFLEVEALISVKGRDRILETTPEDKKDLIEKTNFHSIAYAESVKFVNSLHGTIQVPKQHEMASQLPPPPSSTLAFYCKIYISLLNFSYTIFLPLKFCC